MVYTVKPTQAQAWSKLFACPPVEFGPTLLQVISGAIPEGLRGSLYRNGPARLERGGQHASHWLDGDGAVLRVHFTDAEVTAVYRYVQTAEYQAEEKAGKLIFGGYGMTPPGNIWQRLFTPMKNPANTSVAALPDRLLALWEGGPPHALDLETLDTYGIDTLGGELNKKSFYSAHLKCDPQTKEIYNFGISYGRKGLLHLYRSAPNGQLLQKATVNFEGLPYFHDFILTSKYLIFFVPPLRMNPFPFLLKLSSFSDSLSWQPEKGTQIFVVDRATLEVVSRGETEPWFQWHFGNGYVDANGDVVADVIRYDDFQINQYFRKVITGQTQTAPKSALCKLHLDPRTGKLIEMYKVVDRTCEFPVVAAEQVGQPWRFTYFLTHRSGTDVNRHLWNTIACFEHQTGKFTEAEMGENCYPMEPIYVPDAGNPKQGWILTVVFNGVHESSEVWIFDANHIDADPICKLALPEIVPIGFHGAWKPANL